MMGRARPTFPGYKSVWCVGREGASPPGGGFARQHARGPVPHHDGYSDRSEDVYQRHHPRLIAHNVQMRLMVSFTAGLEALVLLLFLGQPLHDPDGSQRLLRQGSKLADAGAGLAGGNLDATFVAEDGPK